MTRYCKGAGAPDDLGVSLPLVPQGLGHLLLSVDPSQQLDKDPRVDDRLNLGHPGAELPNSPRILLIRLHSGEPGIQQVGSMPASDMYKKTTTCFLNRRVWITSGYRP
jgi:hypothetical protein